MTDEDNPNPEILLKRIMREEEQRKKGTLKIFIGMAAGVGKTFAMLEAAQKLKKEGVDIVVGVVRTHGRQETAQLLEGLELIPEKSINYRDSLFEEFDIDRALQRKPQLILIDELAHTNIPGSRHPKRWQDVVEILDNGINVYTTLNVQHIESLKDVVEQITEITIRETVPDQVIDQATLIELIDITPDELLRRLKEGKVYFGDQSTIAARHFFQEDKLTALREIVLRYAANKIDHDLKGLASDNMRSDAWKPRERLLVAISHSPHSQKLIRTTRRLAFNLDAPWIALHIDTGNPLDEEDQAMLEQNFTLARELGGEVISISDNDISKGIKRIADQKGASQIIIGRPPGIRFFDFFVGNRLIDHLARDCSNIDLHVIRQTIQYNPRKLKWHLPRISSQFISYFFVSLFIFSLTFINWSFLSSIGYRVAGGNFLIGILTLSLFFKKGPIFFASIIYALIWIFLFTPLTRDPNVSHEDIVLLVLYFFTAICTGILTDRARKNSEILTKREHSIEVLYDVIQDIADSPTNEQVLISITQRLSSVLEGRCEIAIKGIDNKLKFDHLALFKNEKEQLAASWVFLNGKEAGWSTSTLPACQNMYIPLNGLKGVVGTLAYHSKQNKKLSIEDKNFLYTVCQQLAHYLERSLEEEKAHQIEQEKEVKKVYEETIKAIEQIFEGPLLKIRESVKKLEPQKTPSDLLILKEMKDAINHLSNILKAISSHKNKL